MQMVAQHVQELSDQDIAQIISAPVLGWAERGATGINGLGLVATNPRTTGSLLEFSVIALAAIHTAETLPWLDKLIDHKDRQVRITAMGGLSQFVNGYPIRTAENFRDMSFMKASPTPYSSDPSWKTCVVRTEATDADQATAGSCWRAWLRNQRLVQ